MVWSPTYRHVKRGSDYEIIGCGFMKLGPNKTMGDGSRVIILVALDSAITVEPWFPNHHKHTAFHLATVQASKKELKDGDPIVVYKSEKGAIWVRSYEEFMDGRFVRLTGSPIEHFWGHHIKKCADLTLALTLFREFAIKNATQWQLGSNHHHPIWAMLSELLGDDVEEIRNGPYYRFIHHTNKSTLEELMGENNEVG